MPRNVHHTVIFKCTTPSGFRNPVDYRKSGVLLYHVVYGTHPLLYTAAEGELSSILIHRVNTAGCAKFGGEVLLWVFLEAGVHHRCTVGPLP